MRTKNLSLAFTIRDVQRCAAVLAIAAVPPSFSGAASPIQYLGNLDFNSAASSSPCVPDTHAPPLQYCARTDMCETGTEPGCSVANGTPKMKFLGRNTTDANGVYHPLDNAPNVSLAGNGLYGANKCVADPDFHSKICRATDYGMLSVGNTFGTGSAGESNMWASDGSAFLVINGGGGKVLFAFSNDSRMTSTLSDISGTVAGGDATHFANSKVAFSATDPNTLYEFDFGRTTANGKPYNQLNKLTLHRTGAPANWTLTRTKLFNFNTDSAKCLPADFYPNWAGSFLVSSDDKNFQFALSDHGQNGQRDATHPYGATIVVAFTQGLGCRVLNTYGTNGQGPMTIKGDWGAVGTALNGSGGKLNDVMYLHESGPTPNSAYSAISGSDINTCTPTTCSCTSGGKPVLCEQFIWETATRNIRPVNVSGHSAKGNLNEYKGHFYAAVSYQDPTTPLTKLLTQSIPVDQHGSYHNADNQDRQPVFLMSSKVCGQASGPGSAPCLPAYSSALYDEVVAVENQASHATAKHCNYGNGPTACEYRFAHTFNTGTSWNFSVQNAIGNVSPTGRFALFTSDWNLTLGCTNGSSSGCLDNIAATTRNACGGNLGATPCQRGDVFVVQLQ